MHCLACAKQWHTLVRNPGWMATEPAPPPKTDLTALITMRLVW